MTVGVAVSDGLNDVSDISVGVNYPFHILLLIIFIQHIMQCLSGEKNGNHTISRCQRQQTHISGVFI